MGTHTSTRSISSLCHNSMGESDTPKCIASVMRYAIDAIERCIKEGDNHAAYEQHLKEARRITKQSLDMLDAEIKKVESINLEIMGGAEKVVGSESVRVEQKSVELVASPVFDPKLNFWYTGTPPALEEPLVEINPQEEGGKMPWESNTTELSDNLVFDPKLNFWFPKRSNEQDEETRAAATREKMEKEG